MKIERKDRIIIIEFTSGKRLYLNERDFKELRKFSNIIKKIKV